MKISSRHRCWSFDDHRWFDEQAREHLRAGLAAGEQVWLVGGRQTGPTGEWLRDVAAARRPGTARIVAIEEAYGRDHVVDPAGQVAAYAAATAGAVAAGFTGLRVVADATPLVRTPEQREAFARYEYLIGRYMDSEPMQAVCAYDRTELGEVAVAELACLHENSAGTDVTFQLHPGATPATAVLDGELDMATEDLFAGALRRTDLAARDGEVTVDATGLSFVDHRSLLILQRYAASRDFTVALRTRLSAAARMAELIELSRVRVEIAR